MRINVLILVLSLSFSSCEKENNGTSLLNYDTENITAPQFLPGDYEMAARFPANQTAPFQGRMLEEVEVYLLERPSRTEILIYDEGDGTEPGDILHSQVVTTAMRPNSWNTVVLDVPIEITGDELWISCRVRHRDPYGTVGCDAGPANPNGDLLFTADDGWTTLRDFSNQAIDINWNIRGVVGP